MLKTLCLPTYNVDNAKSLAIFGSKVKPNRTTNESLSQRRTSLIKFGIDTLKTKRTLEVDGKKYDYYDLEAAGEAKLGDISRLPFSLKVLLENLLRFEDGTSITIKHLEALTSILKGSKIDQEIAYRPARVLMQDFTGVPAIVDLAAMRDAMGNLGGDSDRINPLSRADLVIDHSVQVDKSGSLSAFQANVDIEMSRNRERYEFLRWGQRAFNNFNVIPPEERQHLGSSRGGPVTPPLISPDLAGKGGLLDLDTLIIILIK